MKRITRIFLFLFAAVLLSTPVSAPAAAPVAIEFWEQDGADQQAVLDEAIADFMNENPGITVKRTHFETEDLRRNYVSADAYGAVPDVVLGPNDNLGIFVPYDLVVPMDKIVGEDYLREFDPVALDCAAYNGKQYMLPDRLGNELCLIINKKLVDKAPATWDELVSIGMKLKKEKRAEYPLAVHMVEPFFTVPFFGAFGVQMFDDPKSAKAKPTLNTPQMLEWCRFMVRIQKAGIIPAECDYDTASNLFKQGKVPFLINGPWSFVDYIENAEMSIAIAPIPPISGKFPSPLCAVKGYTVSKKSMNDKKKVNAVELFVRHMTGKKVQLAINSTTKQLPTLKVAAADPAFLSDPLISGQKAQLEKAVPMPIIVQMRAVWDAVKPVQHGLFTGKIKPEDAPVQMQRRAEEGIEALGLKLK